MEQERSLTTHKALEEQIPELFFKEKLVETKETITYKNQALKGLSTLIFLSAFAIMFTIFFVSIIAQKNDIVEQKTQVISEKINPHNYLKNKEVRDISEKIVAQLLTFDYNNYKRNIVNTDDDFVSSDVMRKYLAELKKGAYLERVKKDEASIVPQTDVPEILKSYVKNNQLGFIVQVPVKEIWVTPDKKAMNSVSVLLELVSTIDKPKDLLIKEIKINQNE